MNVYDTAYNNYNWESHTYNSSGDYTVTFTNTAGCDSSRPLHLVIKTDNNCTLLIPNAITPNGDGINDAWIISKPGTNCFKQIDIYVFNRYGMMVYEKTNYRNDWRGIYHSKTLPDGTYYYFIKGISVNNPEKIFKGNITILR